MPLIGVALLSTLSSLEPAPDLLDPLCGLECYLSTLHEPLTDLAPKYWSPTLTPVEHLERSSVYFGVVAVVIRKFC